MHPRSLIAFAFTSLLLGGVGTALAGEQFDELYHNTLNVYTSMGVSHYYINADHTWSADTYDRRRAAGTWSQMGGKVCFHRPRHKDECFALTGRKVGEPWVLTEEKSQDEDGYEDYVAIIHAGREYDVTVR